MSPAKQWPKAIPTLSAEQEAIREDFMHYWHEFLPRNYGLLERFNHQFPAARRTDWPIVPIRTLEIGAGFGAHLAYEDLSFQDYTVLELRESMAERITTKYPQVKVLIGDVQERIAVPEGHFNRIVAVHVLEHLPNLPAALRELRRVLHPDGCLSVVLPCEGGLGYGLARKMSSKRLFEKRYNSSYDWFIESEHVNTYEEIIEELKVVFTVKQTKFWPLPIPNVHTNLVVGVTCTH